MEQRVRAVAMRRGARPRSPLVGGLLLAGTLLPICPARARAQTTSPCAPASPEAQAIADLFIAMLIVAAGSFLFVAGMLIYMIIRFHARQGDPEPSERTGGAKLEILWTISPAIVLAVVYVLMMPSFLNLPTPHEPELRVEAIGHRFWWEFRYPDLNVVTANELHMPTGTDVEVRLTSADVIHSFWVPRLNGKLDLVAGKANTLALYTDLPDTYLGQCAEFCGLQHAQMLLRVIAQPPSEFEAWVARQRQSPAAPQGGPAVRGRDVFFSETCINCHAIDGTPANGNVGPNLTHVGSRQTLAAGALANTPENLRRWLQNPQVVKPGAAMPALGGNITPDQLNTVVEFLTTRRAQP